jgi:hypothetical protein
MVRLDRRLMTCDSLELAPSLAERVDEVSAHQIDLYVLM